ncbi:MAG: glycosyltransferase [Gammaproteobacteria bacterium]|jgi:glycosyltransferase involved in cell wall biosynthesis|nr:glycosyltransferase [Gammaproteobacteria bacterium]MBT4492693.1 glycosyltransferase [Gammaproteobacteria bacterium]MBT7370754.1 glycosyltransferase [Gammaproteobacteria bacterium]
MDKPEVAIIVPCHNEAAAIGTVIDSFRAAREDVQVYVYDNASTDDTSQVALEHGAIVRKEIRRGKGNVVRRMFADIEADIYVLVDGDDTYDPDSLNAMIDRLLTDHLDMVTGKRIEQNSEAYRFGHRFGNRILAGITRSLFGRQSFDLLSGYRVMSRRFVKSFPAVSSGFEIETELTIHALSLNIPTDEMETPYKERPEDSESKLNTYRDGVRILSSIMLFTKEERPFLFFSALAAILAALSILLGIPITLEFFETGLVPRFPTAILAASIMLLAFLSLTTGMTLDSVARGRREQKRLAYLRLPWLS